MTKRILLTGATDGIGLETAKRLAEDGHSLLLHGRSAGKLGAVADTLKTAHGAKAVATYRADLSRLKDVLILAADIRAQHDALDVLINNAGVFNVPVTRTDDGGDIRFAVNTIAPYVLTNELLPLMSSHGRVVNVSSAAQAPVDLMALSGSRELPANAAYAQSKLAITMWSLHMAAALGSAGPSVVAVNPASFLGSKMVKEAYGTAGKDLGIGAAILVRAAVDNEFAGVTGRYYDNDTQQFADPHSDALDKHKRAEVVTTIETVIANTLG